MTFSLLSLLMTSPTIVWAEVPMVLELNQVTVSETKPNGKRWDFGLGRISKPDLVITVSLDGEQILTTKKCKNTLSCMFERSAPFMLKGEQVLRFKVIDKDLKKDDLIDSLTVKLKEGEFNGKQEFKLAGKSTAMLSLTLRPFLNTKKQATPPLVSPSPPTHPSTPPSQPRSPDVDAQQPEALKTQTKTPETQTPPKKAPETQTP